MKMVDGDGNGKERRSWGQVGGTYNKSKRLRLRLESRD